MLSPSDAGADLLQPVEGCHVGIVGRDQRIVVVEDRETVLDRLDGVPQASLCDLDLLVGDGQVGLDALVLVGDVDDLLARLDDLFRQGAGMQPQLAVGRIELGLLELQQAFGGQPAAPFVGEFLCQTHAVTRARRGAFTRIGMKIRLTGKRAQLARAGCRVAL